jgi:putative ABC transport system substrate-binding protein
MRRRDVVTLLGGSAVAWPLGLRAQQSAMPLVGVLRPNRKDELDTFAEPFRRYMKAVGWEDGRNIRFVFVWMEARSERAPVLAGQLVEQKVDLIITFGDPAIRAAQGASQTVPIIGMTDDMVGSGLAAHLAHPGANTTGVSILASELDVKRLEILREFIPHARRIAVLADPTTISTHAQLEGAARELALELVRVDAGNLEELRRAFDAIAELKVGAVNVLASPFLQVSRLEIISHMHHLRLPAMYQWPESAEDGGLLAYGPRLALCYRHVVSLVDKVLRGAHPAHLPIEQPSKFELAVNLKTASAMSITFSPSLLLRADTVIE